MNLRWGAAVGLAVLGGVAFAASSDRGVAAGTLGGRLSVGYTTERALSTALRDAPGTVVVRRLGALRIVDVRTNDVGRAVVKLRGTPGIRFVQRPASRSSVGDPG